ncbi:hypothetical protein [Streptomyces xanthochromogenes]|uniref:Uncharacterized protein n=1 Tax=Streptomyces xanthochromogenes TaxID=67384 RepID=A0ABQ3ABU0_9ACTN|nr:hypothetical protein [Streptomyces xanthochromogenes]GGY41324.1 hypothetical protein GCM10010326_39330 [Streptomyces xanthochromogenes]
MITSDSAPLLRPDVFLTPSGNGTVYVRSSRGTDLIAAPGIAGWLDRLTPFLDGTRTVGQLVDGLDEARRAMVLRILQLIDSHGLLTDQALPDPDPRTASYPHLRALVLGAPAATSALTSALHLTGLSAVTPVADPAAARAAVAAGAHDALLVLAGGDDPRAVARLDEDCRTHGLWFAAAVGDAESWWLGPLLAPGPHRAGGGWLGAWLRVHGTGALPPVSQHPQYVNELAATLLVHSFQQAFVRGAPSSAPEQPDPLVRLDATTLTSTRHSYRPHPSVLPAAPESEAEFLAKIADLREAPPVSPEEFSRRAASRIDRRGGLLAELDEAALPQFPRHASRALVRDPYTGRAEHQVHATGTDFTTARLRTVQRALALYALLALDSRRFIPAAGGPSLWAWSPEHGTAHLVPAATVGARGPRAPRGLGSGATFDEAVAAALRGRGGHAHGQLVVPLDHDPAATEILPHLLRAVRFDD